MRRLRATTVWIQRALTATLVLLAIADTGCGSSPPPPPRQTRAERRAARSARGRRGAPAATAFGDPGSSGAATTAGAPVATGAAGMIQAADRALQPQHYQPIGQAAQNIANRGFVSFQFPAQPTVCYTVIAIGDTGVSDIDMAVIAPSGAQMGEDRNPDSHPSLSFCAVEAGTHLARVNMFAGTGNVLFRVYQAPAGSQGGNLAGVFEGGTAPAAAIAPLDPATGTRITAFRTTMAAAGYQPVREPSGVAMRTGQTDTWPTTLTAGWCYAFGTFGGAGATDSDIFLFDQTGSRQIAGDGTTVSADAAIRDVCPTATSQYQLRPRLGAGNGTVWFVAMARPNTQAGTAATAQAAQGNVNINTQTQAGAGGMDGSYRVVERQLVSLGYAAVGAPVTAMLATGVAQPQPVTLQAGSCYAIAALGDSSVQDLDLVLVDAANAEADRDRSHDARPIVRVCPTTSGQFTVRIQMTAGQGQFRMGLFRWEGGTNGAGMTGLLFVRNAEVTRILQADNYQGDADFELYRGRVAQGATTNRPVNLRQGVCYAFAAVAGSGLSELDMTLRRGSQTLGEDNALTGYPVVRFCATANGPHQVGIRSVAGAGEFVFRVFRQQAPEPAASGG